MKGQERGANQKINFLKEKLRRAHAGEVEDREDGKERLIRWQCSKRPGFTELYKGSFTLILNGYHLPPTPLRAQLMKENIILWYYYWYCFLHLYSRINAFERDLQCASILIISLVIILKELF